MKVLVEFAKEMATMALKRANRDNDPFHSDHEGYAVLLEELQEAECELNAARRNLGCVWVNIREDDHEQTLKYIDKVYEHAILLIAEASQVAAMCRKFKGETDETE